MIKEFCDICGEEINSKAPANRYKIKKEWNSWYETGWSRLVIHDECWEDLCALVKEGKSHE